MAAVKCGGESSWHAGTRNLIQTRPSIMKKEAFLPTTRYFINSRVDSSLSSCIHLADDDLGCEHHH